MTHYDVQFYKAGKRIVFLILSMVLLSPSFSFAQQGGGDKMLILYYSMTGNTRACCEALQQALEADMIEIKDLNDRSGRWGYVKTAIGSLLGMHTDIEPENPDLSTYPNIILGSPIWTGKLSMAIRTLIDTNNFDGKKVVIFTTTNAFEKETYKEKSKDLVRKAGGDVVGYYQVLAKEEVGDEKVDRAKELIVEDARALAPAINKTFSLGQ
jgi:flavodoxin